MKSYCLSEIKSKINTFGRFCLQEPAIRYGKLIYLHRIIVLVICVARHLLPTQQNGFPSLSHYIVVLCYHWTVPWNCCCLGAKQSCLLSCDCCTLKHHGLLWHWIFHLRWVIRFCSVCTVLSDSVVKTPPQCFKYPIDRVSDVILHLGSKYSKVLEIGGVKEAVLILILIFLSLIFINTQLLSDHNDNRPSRLLHGIGCPRRNFSAWTWPLKMGQMCCPKMLVTN